MGECNNFHHEIYNHYNSMQYPVYNLSGCSQISVLGTPNWVWKVGSQCKILPNILVYRTLKCKE